MKIDIGQQTFELFTHIDRGPRSQFSEVSQSELPVSFNSEN